MGKNAVDRFEFRFPDYTYRSIRLCLQDREGVAASILLCCAIDLLARFRSGNPEKGFNKRKFVTFLQAYFPSTYDPKQFYEFVRCGLLHSFNMENQYTILCNEEEWAKKAHLQIDPERGTIVINPFILFQDVRSAFKKYMFDLRNDADIQKAFYRVHREIPLKRQQVSWRKMKHLKRET